MFTNTMAWPAEPYRADLPPPLCFTTPAGDRGAEGPLIRTGGLAVTLRTPKLMMDPSDETTWQRPYRFTR
jgi:hypothetical protein